jgi:uridine kinase
VATGSPSESVGPVAALVVDLATARPATLGTGRLVCVDGPAGSGKTTLGEELARQTGAQLIHGDDLMSGWRGLAAVERQLATLFSALAEGRAGSYERYDWMQSRYAGQVGVAPAAWLVVEGVGSGAPELAAYTTVLAWVEADDDLRLARGLERDGEELLELYQQFMVDERELFTRDRTRERADVLVDGTGASPPVIARP